MGDLTVTVFTSLDGVMQGPGAPEEDRSGGFAHGGWLAPHVDEAFGRTMAAIFTRPDAFLLGRGTYEIFAGWWPKVTDPKDPIAGPLNALPKYVASRTLQKADWNATTLVRDVMTRLVYGVRAGDSVLAAIRLMLDEQIHRVIAVNDDGSIAGVIVPMDILRVLARKEVGRLEYVDLRSLAGE